MGRSSKSKKDRQAGISGINSRIKAVIDDIGDGAPNERQIIILAGSLLRLQAKAKTRTVFAGERGAEIRDLTDRVINLLSAMDAGNKQQWQQNKGLVSAAWTVLQAAKMKDVPPLTRAVYEAEAASGIAHIVKASLFD